MTRAASRRAVAVTLGLWQVWLNGGAIGTPWPQLPTRSSVNADETVVLVLIHVTVHRAQRRDFDRENDRVLACMGIHAGLIGSAARRQVLGDQG